MILSRTFQILQIKSQPQVQVLNRKEVGDGKDKMPTEIIFSFFIIFVSWISFTHATNRYYQTYLSYGSGDTMIQNYHAHGGSVLPNKKWNVECLDGEAMVGIADNNDDFIRLQTTWCKFTFPQKPATNGLYPYYSGCHVRNLTDSFHCYDPTRHALTSNTFVTAIQSANLFFWIHRIPTDNVVPYKCCKTPFGFYIDYVSCYYQPTHDMFFEYYDSPTQYIVYCVQGYVMTGISKKINPYTKEFRYDWIQCCRVGFGQPLAHRPPVTYMPSGVPAYHDQVGPSTTISGAYESQYRSKKEDEMDSESLNKTETKGFIRRDGGRQLDVEQRLFAERGIRSIPDEDFELNAVRSRRFKRRI